MTTLTVGIDASNIRAGGGLTYLANILQGLAEGHTDGVQAIVWGADANLSRLPSAACVIKSHQPMLDGALHSRVMWQLHHLERLAESCDVLFVPGGTYVGSHRPFVTMSHNLLPFDAPERTRYGMSRTRLRLETLRVLQSRTFRRADGLIFLTRAAQKVVERTTGPTVVPNVIVPHGIDAAFVREPRWPKPITAYSVDMPFRWLYVSTVALYKHQWNVVSAAARLRASGIPIALDLVGPATPQALRKLQQAIVKYDPSSQFVKYHGPVSGADLVQMYHEADALVFASTCENMPIILLEGMSAGLPIACADRPVMREVLEDGGVYCDPERIDDIERVMREVVLNEELRRSVAQRAFTLAGNYSWSQSAEATFGFLRQIALTAKRRASGRVDSALRELH